MRHRSAGCAVTRRALVLLGLGQVAGAAPAQDELVLGVLPNISSVTLTAQYELLRSYVDKQDGTKLRIVLPGSFKAFFDATLRGDFDLAVAAPHFARVAQLDAKLLPLVMYEPRIGAQLITPADAPLASARELRGKALALANPGSLVALYGLQWLRSQGLEPGRDVALRAARTDMGVGRMLLTREAAAAIMSSGEFRALPPDESARLKVALVFAHIPNFIVLGHPRLGPERLARLKAQLLAFGADKLEGAAFAKATGVAAIAEADEATLRELDPYTAATRRAMGVGP
jgi:phosphonate transport system substrate-binding protein